MDDAVVTSGWSGAEPAGARGLRRFGARSLLGWSAMLVGGVPFLLQWLLVQHGWAPLAALDGDVAARLNEVVNRSPALLSTLRVVTEFGGTPFAALAFTLTTVFLTVRGRRRLAAFVAVTGVGVAVLVPITKAIVDRARPVLEAPVVQTPSNASFPSGHAMTSLVAWGVLLLPVLLAPAVALSRLYVAAHFPTDVLAGLLLGTVWLLLCGRALLPPTPGRTA